MIRLILYQDMLEALCLEEILSQRQVTVGLYQLGCYLILPHLHFDQLSLFLDFHEHFDLESARERHRLPRCHNYLTVFRLVQSKSETNWQ